MALSVLLLVLFKSLCYLILVIVAVVRRHFAALLAYLGLLLAYLIQAFR
jgi:hypothetical protein